MYGRICDSRMEPYPSRVGRDLDVGPRGNFPRALTLVNPANQRSADGAGVSTPCGAVPTRGIIFRPRAVGVVNVWKDI